jgi:hypothetical protein
MGTARGKCCVHIRAEVHDVSSLVGDLQREMHIKAANAGLTRESGDAEHKKCHVRDRDRVSRS